MTYSRSERARRAAIKSWQRTGDRAKRTAPAPAALEARFLSEAGGDPIMVERLRSAHYARLGMLSGRARRLKSARAVELELIEWRAAGLEVMTMEQLAAFAELQRNRHSVRQ